MIEASEVIYEFSADPEFASELAAARADLAAKQERLGPEFERVLFENLWDLYVPSSAHEAPPSDSPPACPSPTSGAGGGT